MCIRDSDGTCEYDSSDCLDDIEFSTSSGLEELTEEHLLIKAFSPPLSQTIKITALENSQVKVVDITGKVIFNKLIISGSQIVVETPSKGVFMIMATKEFDGSTQTTKLYVH